MLTQLEFLGFCFAMLAMILIIVKYERRIRRWSLRYPRRRGKLEEARSAPRDAEMSFDSTGTGENICR